jgi:hypothetical protein
MLVNEMNAIFCAQNALFSVFNKNYEIFSCSRQNSTEINNNLQVKMKFYCCEQILRIWHFHVGATLGNENNSLRNAFIERSSLLDTTGLNTKIEVVGRERECIAANE